MTASSIPTVRLPGAWRPRFSHGHFNCLPREKRGGARPYPGDRSIGSLREALGVCEQFAFSKVLLFGIDQGAIPRPLRDEQYTEDAWADALLRERSLLYVAATRARDELALSWSGDPSQLLPAAEQG